MHFTQNFKKKVRTHLNLVLFIKVQGKVWNFQKPKGIAHLIDSN